MNPPPETTGREKNPFRDIYVYEETKKKGPSFFGGIARFVLLLLIGTAAGGAGVALQGYFFFTQNLPSIDKLKNYSPPIVSRFFGSKGELIADFAEQKRFVVSINEVPEILQQAFVSAEDKNFWVHGGVDKEAIVRAAKRNLMAGKMGEGASTITQQVAKTFLLTTEKKLSRKIKEAILATQIERSLNKEEILYLYLNQIYLGSGAYGVEAAAQTYFDKHVQDLTIAECAMLAGLPKAPSEFSPRRKLPRALERRAYVLKRMLEDRYISIEQYEEALKEEPKLVYKQNPHTKVAFDFVEHVRRYVVEKYGSEAVQKEGLQVYTTIDLDLSKEGFDAVDAGLRELDKREGYRGPIKTLNVQGVMDFLEEKTKSMDQPLKFGQLTEGVITQIDQENVYVRMGSYIKGEGKREYVGQIKIDPSSKWWCRRPFMRPEMRTRNFAPGDLPFQVGDLIQVRLVDPNIRRRELYLKKYGKTDPQLTNYKEYNEDMVTYFPLELEQEPVAQSALMLRENKTGYVRVMVGGHSGAGSKYNRATQSRRQAGSSFKPAIYAAALNKGFTCSDIIIDSPLALTVPGTGEVWRPKNYRGGFQGPVTLRDCLVQSRNIPTIKILQQIGLDQARAYARKLGYTSPMVSNLTLALGSTGVSLEEQLSAFSVFPNKGYSVPQVYITKIVDRNGKILEEHLPPVLLDDPVPSDKPAIQTVSHSVPPAQQTERETSASDREGGPAKRVIDEGTAYIMCSLLQGVVQEGTATVLKKIVGRPDIAGKTGTTNENVDAWFMGFSPEYTCGVWVGFDDDVTIGEGETGGKAAAPIWGYFMKQVLKDKPVKEFTAPASVEFRRIDPKTGLLTSSSNGFLEIFKTGSSPSAPEPKLIKGSRWDNYGSDLDQF